MNDNAPSGVPTRPSRIEHHIDQLIWRLAKIEGDMQDLRRSLNAFRADLTLTYQPAPPPDASHPDDVA